MPVGRYGQGLHFDVFIFGKRWIFCSPTEQNIFNFEFQCFSCFLALVWGFPGKPFFQKGCWYVQNFGRDPKCPKGFGMSWIVFDFPANPKNPGSLTSAQLITAYTNRFAKSNTQQTFRQMWIRGCNQLDAGQADRQGGRCNPSDGSHPTCFWQACLRLWAPLDDFGRQCFV